MNTKLIDFDLVREIALSLPGVVESTIHGAPSLKLRGKLMACPALHSSAEPGTIVVKLDFDQRDRLIADAPLTCYLTDHYVNQPVVLVRLSRIDRDSLTGLLNMAWHFVSSQNKTSGRRGRNESQTNEP